MRLTTPRFLWVPRAPGTGFHSEMTFLVSDSPPQGPAPPLPSPAQAPQSRRTALLSRSFLDQSPSGSVILPLSLPPLFSSCIWLPLTLLSVYLQGLLPSPLFSFIRTVTEEGFLLLVRPIHSPLARDKAWPALCHSSPCGSLPSCGGSSFLSALAELGQVLPDPTQLKQQLCFCPDPRHLFPFR